MHTEALTKEAHALVPLFGSRSFGDFYLVGGTALALQIGHRRSVDFDFFSEKALPENLLGAVKRVFADQPVSVTYRAPEQLNLIIGGVKTTFFEYPYRTIFPLVSYPPIALGSMLEIALMKAFSIGKRLSYKDYVDWYFLLREKLVTLEEVLAGASKKFGADFNDRLFLGQLVSMQDIPTQKIDFLRDPISRAVIEQTLAEAVKKVGGMK